MVAGAHPDLYVVRGEPAAERSAGNHRPIGYVPVLEGFTVPHDGLTDLGPKAVRTDQRGRGYQAATVRRHEKRAVALDEAAHSVPGVQRHTRMGVECVQKYSLHVRAIGDAIRMTEALEEGGAQLLAEDLPAACAVAEANRVRRKGDLFHAIIQSPLGEDPKGIGTELNPRAHLADRARPFEHFYGKSLESEGQGDAQAPDPGAGDYDRLHIRSMFIIKLYNRTGQ